MASIAGLRYIKPLFELAKEKSLTDEVHEGIKAFGRVLEDQVNEGSGELEAILLNPRIPAAQKKAILMKMTEGDFPQLLKDFFCLLVDKGRERVFLFLEQEFTRLVMEASGVVPATVQSPVDLDDDYKRDLARRLAEVSGKTVELTEELKPELIAGVRILLGSKMLDGSLKARLDGMRSHLVKHCSVKA